MSASARDDMAIDYDVAITMDDGTVLRADVFRPSEGGRYPVVLSHSPYGKGLAFQEAYADAWNLLVGEFPEVERASSCRYQNWEAVDPERWVPDGYVCVRVDARGWGRSPGYADPWSPREIRDFYECIEWAARQPWSTGKVGLAGISYMATNQWLVAALRPPHLAAMIPWEGLADFYRDFCYHGGIPATTPRTWYLRALRRVQHGLGSRGARDPNTGELVSGPETLTEEELQRNAAPWLDEIARHPLDGPYWRAYTADWERIEVPFLSSGNWGGAGMHLRGNTEAFTRAASEHKWLEIHGLEHWLEFYSDYGVALQKRFFDHFLKGMDNGWADRPPVLLRVRTVRGFIDRAEQEWPLARTEWTPLHLDAASGALDTALPTDDRQASFEALGDGVTFRTPPLPVEREITGPVSAKLFVSSSTTDADLFLVLRVFDPQGKEVLFRSAVDPRAPVAQGWLRASHRKLDEALTAPHRPYHRHDEPQPLMPGDIYPLEIELWATSLVVPAGYRVALTVLGRDFENDPADLDDDATLNHFQGWKFRGCGIYLHDEGRPADVYGGTTTIHTGPQWPSHLVLPVVPR